MEFFASVCSDSESAACSICNRRVKHLNPVYSFDQIYFPRLVCCMLYELTSKKEVFFLCFDCCDLIGRCAINVTLMQTRAYLIYGMEDASCCCTMCKSPTHIKMIRFLENSAKHIVLRRYVGNTPLRNPSFICEACDDVLQDLEALQQYVLDSIIEQAENRSEETVSLTGVTSNPIDIKNPRPNFSLYRSGGNDDYDTILKNKHLHSTQLFLKRENPKLADSAQKQDCLTKQPRKQTAEKTLANFSPRSAEVKNNGTPSTSSVLKPQDQQSVLQHSDSKTSSPGDGKTPRSLLYQIDELPVNEQLKYIPRNLLENWEETSDDNKNEEGEEQESDSLTNLCKEMAEEAFANLIAETAAEKENKSHNTNNLNQSPNLQSEDTPSSPETSFDKPDHDEKMKAEAKNKENKGTPLKWNVLTSLYQQFFLQANGFKTNPGDGKTPQSLFCPDIDELTYSPLMESWEESFESNREVFANFIAETAENQINNTNNVNQLPHLENEDTLDHLTFVPGSPNNENSDDELQFILEDLE